MNTAGQAWRYLDEHQQWFRIPTSRNTFETMLWKILAVAPEIQVGELREGLTRHYRTSSAPSDPQPEGEST